MPYLAVASKKKSGVGRIPIEILGEIVGRDREGENPTLVIAFDHEFEEGAVDHVRFGLKLAVAGIELPAADDDLLVLHVVGDGPIEGEIGKGVCQPQRDGTLRPKMSFWTSCMTRS